MTPIRLQFVRAAGISSRLIEWWGEGSGGWSHVDALLPHDMLLGARSDSIGGKPPGVQVRPQNYAKWLRKLVLEVPATEFQGAQWAHFLGDQIGRQYNIPGIFDFLLGEKPEENGKYFCSQLQTIALQMCGKLPGMGIPAAQVTPNALELICRAIGAKEVSA